MNGIALPVAVLLALYMLARFYRGGVCVQCQGRGRHRDGCPFDKGNP